MILSCGGGGGGPSREEFVASYCSLLQPCCARAKLSSDGMQCRLIFAIVSRNAYDASAGDRCLTESRAASQRADFCSDSVMWPTVCQSVFKQDGKKQPGESCADNTECAPSPEGPVGCQRQFVGTDQVVSKCQIQLRGKEGDQPCVGTMSGEITSFGAITGEIAPRAYVCRTADGLACNYDTRACTRLEAVGGPCSRSDQCLDGAYCHITGKCAASVPAGGMCSGLSTSGSDCLPGAFCASSSKTCVAELGHGMACDEDQQCKSRNCVTGKCEGDDSSDLGLALFCGSP
jgi:hypothetical protein